VLGQTNTADVRSSVLSSRKIEVITLLGVGVPGDVGFVGVPNEVGEFQFAIVPSTDPWPPSTVGKFGLK
jgi:hypothetical protein